MKKIPVISLILIMVACGFATGCATQPAKFDFTQSPKGSTLPPDLSMANVQLEPKLAGLVDHLAMPGPDLYIQTGKIFAQVFTGGVTTPARLDYINSSISQNVTLGAFVVNPHTNVNYSISVALNQQGQTRIFSSTATGMSESSPLLAIRRAIEHAIIDLAAQIDYYLKSNAKISPHVTSPPSHS